MKNQPRTRTPKGATATLIGVVCLLALAAVLRPGVAARRSKAYP